MVDDGSTDATADVARRRSGLRLVEAPGHVGVAASRNLGIGAARGSVIAFVDADCVPAPTWIERGLSALEEHEADLLAGHIEVSLGRRSLVGLVDLTQYFDQQRYVAEGFGATGNLWVRREAIERAGLFDERLARGEDKDFCRRAVLSGGRVIYVSDLVVTHPARRLDTQMRRSFAIGTDRGLAGLRARRREGAYVTPERVRARLLSAGYPPTISRLLILRVVREGCIRLPMALGALWAMVRSGWPSGRRADVAS